MNVREVYEVLYKLRKGCYQIGLAIGFLVLSPMMFVTMTAAGIQERHLARVNIGGTVCIGLCILMMCSFLLLGISKIFTYFRQKTIDFTVTKQAYEYSTECTYRIKNGMILGIIVGLTLTTIGVLTVVSVSFLSHVNINHIVLSWLIFFVTISIAVAIFVRAILIFVLLRKIHFKEDESLEEEEINLKKIKRKTRIQLLCIQLIIIGLLFGYRFLYGSWIESIKLVFACEMIFILYMIFSKPFGQWHYLKRKRKKKAVIASLMAVCAAAVAIGIMYQGSWYLQPYIATIPRIKVRECPITYDRQTGVYSIQNPDEGDFKILQLTDIHIGGSNLSYDKDLRALESVYKLIDSTKPDLVIVTGDFVFPVGIESFSFNNYYPMMQFASFMRNIGVPWAFTYGNHDTEFVASHSAEELNKLFASFSYEKTQNLLYTTKQPDITGRSNQMIRVLNSDGSTNQLLFLIDSNSYTGNGINDYDYIHDDQVYWYQEMVETYSKAEQKTVSSLIFTHIPLTEYKTAYDLYKAGSNEVTYYHGIVGEKDEAICCANTGSKLFSKAVELKSTKGIFVGHDHYNNISLGYQGIRLTYGMSIDYLAMPGIAKEKKQRGGTLITLKPDSQIEVENIPLETLKK